MKDNVAEGISAEDKALADSLQNEAEIVVDVEEVRELRVLNRNFSLGEYGESWTKLERYLFIEIYNVVKDFYLSVSNKHIKSLSSESIVINLPINRLSTSLFKANQRNRDLMSAAEGLSKKQISLKSEDDHGNRSFHFISMFPEIKYDPKVDKRFLEVRIPSAVYEDMIPIESYCMLDLKLLQEFNAGSTIRLYEIFKSYAFRKTFTLTFDDLRKKLGFFREGKYTEWKHFNSKILKLAVDDINSQKKYDIEVKYEKARGSADIKFFIKSHIKQNNKSIQILNLNEPILNNEPNLIQQTFINSVITNCEKITKISNKAEVVKWIIADISNQQKKNTTSFDFKHSMNAISKQIREGDYSQPFCYKHISQEIRFSEKTHAEIKSLEIQGFYDEIKAKFSVDEIKANQFGYILQD